MANNVGRGIAGADNVHVHLHYPSETPRMTHCHAAVEGIYT